MAGFDPTKAKNGDRVKNSQTGEEYLLQGGQWVSVQVGPASSAGIRMFDKGIQNVLNTPAALADTAAQASAGLAAGVTGGVKAAGNAIQGDPANFLGEFAGERERILGDENLSVLQGMQNLPRANPLAGENARAALRTAANAATGRGVDMSAALEQERVRGEQARQLFPRAVSVGDFGADAATLLALRRPAARARSSVAKGDRAAAQDFLQEFRGTTRQIDPKVQSKLDDAASKAFKKLKGGAQNLKSWGIKTGEAGLEGAYLAALNSEDPFASAVAAAAAQSAGSLGLSLSTNPRGAAGKAVASAFVTHEIWKTLAPGDQNFFESKDFAFQTVSAALVLGAFGGLAGSGRLSSSAIKHPFLADAATAIPRAAIENRFRELRDNLSSGNRLPEQVMERMSRDPSFFNDNQLNALSRAMGSEKAGSFTKEVDRLMEDSSDFRGRIAKLIEQRQPPEGTEFSGAISPARRLELSGTTHPIIRPGRN